IHPFLGLAVCWPIFHSRVSTSVWTGFVLGFSHPTSTAGSGNQKADGIAEADEFTALVWLLAGLGCEQLGSLTFHQLTKERRWLSFTNSARHIRFRSNGDQKAAPIECKPGTVSAEKDGPV